MPVFGEQLKPEEIWDIVHYVQSLRVAAHEQELVAVGLKEGDLEQARTRMWAALSPAARRGDLEKTIIQAPSDSLRTARLTDGNVNGRRRP